MDGLVSCSIPDIYDNRDGSYISEVCKYVLCIIGPRRLVKTFFSEFVEVKEVGTTLTLNSLVGGRRKVVTPNFQILIALK